MDLPRFLRFPNVVGRFPVSWLPSNTIVVRFCIKPSSDGTVPLRSFRPRYKPIKLVKRPNSVGIVPIKSLLYSMEINSVRRTIWTSNVVIW